MRTLFFIAFLLFSATVFGSERPNIVFILADDLGVNDLGAFNPNTFYETPRLNRLAEEGMRFTSAYTACNVCSPTRYSIMAGKYPVRSGVTNYLAGTMSQRFEPARLDLFMPLEEKTLGEAFLEAGYRTAYVGKWHLGDVNQYGPSKQGFEVVSGDERFLAPEYGEIKFVQHPPIPAEAPKIEIRTTQITEDALAILDAFQSMEAKPFLLYLAYYQVHVPLGASEKYVEPYRKKKAELELQDDAEKDFTDEEQAHVTDATRKARIRQNHAVYAGMVSHCDECVGRILDKLDELGLSGNTIVVFLSDNGGLATAEGSPTSNLPFRAGKGWNYEGGIRTPLIVRWPKSVRPNTVCDVPVISTDFYPTLLDLAGVGLQPQQHVDGVSFAPLLRGEKPDLPLRDMFWHYPHYSNQGGFPSSAIRSGGYKFIQRLEDGRFHLYDLKNDIGERNDLAEKMPEKAAELRKRLFEWYQETGARFLEPKDGKIPWRP
ncbi:MAG: sulfatase [Planctomycetaceae bacterium]|nr:sulfatase [Planctomycetaceae bacterium]